MSSTCVGGPARDIGTSEDCDWSAPFRAFPNAYISTDEPPRRSLLRRALCIVALLGVTYLGLVILVLSILSTEYNPITQVASDYGVGPFAPAMNFGFLVAGVGVISLGLAIASSRLRASAKVGGVILLVSGSALLIDAFFATDVEGAARTLHGTIHGVGGAAFFFTAPVALLLMSHGLGRMRFLRTLVALVVAVIVLVSNAVLSLNASGFAERVVILVIFVSLISTAVKVYRDS